MIIKELRDEDFTNYKLPSMIVGFPSCTFKCEKECNCKGMCQNSELVKSPNIEISAKEIVARYQASPISQALVCGGLEPFDSWDDLFALLIEFRSICDDDFIIYTGYTKEELQAMKYPVWSTSSYLFRLSCFSNVIIKFGRYIPNQKPHYDEVLGIYLASDNQYAEKIS